MGKNPAFLFYVKDWLSDPDLRLASPSTRGIWMDLLCFMKWGNGNGTIRAEYQKLLRMVSSTEKDLDLFISEAEELRFCDISVTCHAESQKYNGIVTIMSRRILRENIDKENARLRQRKHRMKRKNTADVTDLSQPLSSSSSSSSSKKKSTLTSTCPQQKIVDLYNLKFPELPNVKSWPTHLQKILKMRWREDSHRQSLKWWDNYFEFIRQSEFLMGKTKGGFQVDLEWIIRPTNMTKILNGRYHKDTQRKYGGIVEWLKEKHTESSLQE
jgi:hypothetical protein